MSDNFKKYSPIPQMSMSLPSGNEPEGISRYVTILKRKSTEHDDS